MRTAEASRPASGTAGPAPRSGGMRLDEDMTRRYVIIGAGAIGGGIGALLARQGTAVVLVARGEHLARMRRTGIRLRTPDVDTTVAVTAVAGPEEITLGEDDVLVLATKTQQAEAALAAWADAPVGERTAGQALPILTALNGAAAEERALRWFARVIGVCVWMPAVRLEPAEVIVRGAPVGGVFPAARYPAALTTDEDRALIAGIAADWAPAGLRVHPVEDVMPWKHRKLLGNLGNAVQALLGTGDGDVVRAAREEAAGIYEAAGIVLNPEAEEQAMRDLLQVRPVPGEPEEMGGSTWQSLARGTGDSEVDYLSGEIAALAHRMGRTAPINAGLARLTRRAARTGVRPGALSSAELRAQLGL